MQLFTIEPNHFLNQEIQAFYYTDFFGYGKPNNPDFLNILKNDNHQNWSAYQLNKAATALRNILIKDLPQILDTLQLNSLTACVIPRAKADNTYQANQMLFKETISTLVSKLDRYVDGTNYISRHTNTKTTHLRRPIEGYINDGKSPYPGIMADTCKISSNVRNTDILLIDDIYTKTVNIDEDAIQTLLNNGARSVTFYAIGHTVGHYC